MEKSSKKVHFSKRSAHNPQTGHTQAILGRGPSSLENLSKIYRCPWMPRDGHGWHQKGPKLRKSKISDPSSTKNQKYKYSIPILHCRRCITPRIGGTCRKASTIFWKVFSGSGPSGFGTGFGTGFGQRKRDYRNLFRQSAGSANNQYRPI